MDLLGVLSTVSMQTLSIGSPVGRENHCHFYVSSEICPFLFYSTYHSILDCMCLYLYVLVYFEHLRVVIMTLISVIFACYLMSMKYMNYISITLILHCA